MLKIVILGGGFGGIWTALSLVKNPKFKKYKITVVDQRNYFLFTPLLPEVALATINEKVPIEFLPAIVSKYNIEWVVGEVKEVCLKAKTILVGDEVVEYDKLVIALGSEPQTYNTAGVEENCFFLKDLNQAVTLKNQIIQNLQLANRCSDTVKRKKLLEFSIIGGGPTGIELAGEISSALEDLTKKYFKNIVEAEVTLNLISADNRFLPRHNILLDRYVRSYLSSGKNFFQWNFYMNSRVVEVTKNEVKLTDDSVLSTNLTMWMAGVKARKLKFREEVLLDKEGRLIVNENLQLVDDLSVLVLGDMAGGFPMLAQNAVAQARVVAHNLLNDEKQKYVFKEKGFLVSVGKFRAVGELYGKPVRGVWVWILWHIVYWNKFLSKTKKVKLLLDWAAHLFRSRDISVEGR